MNKSKKWVIDSVEKLFSDNGIKIDFSIRGIYQQENKVKTNTITRRQLWYSRYDAMKSLGFCLFCRRSVWQIFNIINKK